MTFPLAVYIGALAIGASIGVLTGMFGVGGGFLITPLLNVLLGVPISIAVGTGVVQILGVSTAGIYRRRGEGLIDYKMALILFGGNYVGVRLGARTLGWLNGMGSISLASHQAPAGEVYTLLIFAVLLIGIAAWMFVDTSRSSAEEPRQGLFARFHIPPYTRFPSVGETPLSIPILSYFGLVLGFLTGLLGIGGGVILLPALVYLVGMRTHCAAATSLVIVWLTSFVATITHSLASNTDLLLAVPLLVGGSLGLQMGVNICNRTKGARLRRYFCFVVLTAVVLILGKLGVLALF